VVELVAKHVAIFVLAAMYDVLLVLLIHHSERKRPYRAALSSVAQTVVSLASLSAALSDWHYWPAYVAGFGCGTYIAVRAK